MILINVLDVVVLVYLNSTIDKKSKGSLPFLEMASRTDRCLTAWPLLGHFVGCESFGAKIFSRCKRWCHHQSANQEAVGIFGLLQLFGYWSNCKMSIRIIFNNSLKRSYWHIEHLTILSIDRSPFCYLLNHLLGSQGAFSTSFLLWMHLSDLLIRF
jgi:hypothetical protein